MQKRGMVFETNLHNNSNNNNSPCKPDYLNKRSIYFKTCQTHNHNILKCNLCHYQDYTLSTIVLSLIKCKTFTSSLHKVVIKS
jgi:hypothetical protein